MMSLMIYHGSLTSWIFEYYFYIHVIIFTVGQGLLSGICCIVLAAFLIRPYYEVIQYWWGKWIYNLINLPFLCPGIITTVCLITCFGHNGVLSYVFACLGLGYNSFLYGLPGIIFCHIFQYLPFVLHYFVRNYHQMPTNLQSVLPVKGIGYYRYILWPIMKKDFGLIFGFIFISCARSFSSFLIFSSSPDCTNMELALFTALESGDISTASQLGLIQGLFNWLFFLWLQKTSSSFSVYKRQDNRHYLWNWSHSLTLCFIFFVFLLPIFSLLPYIFSYNFYEFIADKEFYYSILFSLILGAFLCLLSLFWVWGLVQYSLLWMKKKVSFFIENIPFVPLMISPLILSVFIGLYIPIFDYKIVLFLLVFFSQSFYLTPIVYQTLNTPFRNHHKQYFSLYSVLSIKYWSYLKIQFISLKKPLIYIVVLSMMYAIGDCRILLMFNSPIDNLGLYIYHQMLNYNFGHAAWASLFIMMICYGLLNLTMRMEKEND